MAQVPSNLIPVSISNLPVPVAPASADTLLVGVYQGVTYKIRAGDLLQVAGVPLTRQVIAGTGLTGGGALSSDVTLSIAPGGVGTSQLATTGVTPGVYGNGSTVPQLTIDATGRVTAATNVPLVISGYVPTSRQVVAGNGLLGGGTLGTDVTLSVSYGGSTPLALSGAGATGSALTVSRSDHQHPAVDLADQTQIDGILPIDQGGTGRSMTMQLGGLVWSGADGLYVGPQGGIGQVLVSGGTSAPTWGSALIVAPVPKNVFFGGPTTGSDDDPAFRALVNDDLPNSGVVANTYGSSSQVPVLTVNSKGVITGATTAAITLPSLQALTIGTGLSGTSYDGSAPVTIANTGVLSWSGGTTGLTPATATTGAVTLGGTLVVANGGTGATDAAGARANLSAAVLGTNNDITSMTGLTGGISSPDFIQFDTTATVVDATGRLYYDDADMFQTLAFQMNGSVVQHVGEGMFYRVKLSGAATKGQVMMFTGTLGASGGLTAAPATGLSPEQSNYILGVAMESGALNDWITVVEFGEVKGLDTTGGAEAWVQGDVLYYNPAVAGGLTKTKPASPNAIAVIAAVVYVSPSAGILFVRPTFGSVLGGTDGNVQFGTLSGGDVIVYDSVDSRWENRAQSMLSVGYAAQAGSVANALTAGTYLTSTGTFDGSAARTFAVDATDANTASKVVARDASGNFSAGTITAALNGNAATATSATTATNLAGGAASQLPYQTGAGATGFIANGTAGQVLTSAGAGVPVWSDIAGGTF